MTAASAAAMTIVRAEAAGLTLTADDDKLRWRDRRPSAALLEEMHRHKQDILWLLDLRAAARTKPQPPSVPHDCPLDEAQVQRLAAALMTERLHQRISDPAKAHAYFEAEARRRLGLLRDPISRGLLVQAEKAPARGFPPASPWPAPGVMKYRTREN
jgi:hypothetical protein